MDTYRPKSAPTVIVNNSAQSYSQAEKADSSQQQQPDISQKQSISQQDKIDQLRQYKQLLDEILSGWASSKDENIRRFTTESIRPRGVWCKHIERLKTEPELALPVLEKLKTDSSKYVQDSVGNWLNDASKTSPDFVEDLCERWQSESANKHTEKIIRKALRTLNKA